MALTFYLNDERKDILDKAIIKAKKDMPKNPHKRISDSAALEYILKNFLNSDPNGEEWRYDAIKKVKEALAIK